MPSSTLETEMISYDVVIDSGYVALRPTNIRMRRILFEEYLGRYDEHGEIYGAICRHMEDNLLKRARFTLTLPCEVWTSIMTSPRR